MVLGKLPVPGQGPIALAVSAGGSCLDIFTLPPSEKRPDID